jgi:phage-related tail fiber protein
MPLNITITDQGRAALINASNTGASNISISEIAIGTGLYTPLANQTALQSESKRITSIGGKAVSDDIIHVTLVDESNDILQIGEFGLYTDTGVLFAVYSQSADQGWIIEKSSQASLLLAVDILLGTLDANQIIFGDNVFINPPATLLEKGVVQLSNSLTSTDETKAATPKAIKLLNDKFQSKADSNHAHPNASTSTSGFVQLSNSLASSSENTAATSSAAKQLYDLIIKKQMLVGVPIPWPNSSIPAGYLQMRGQWFNKSTFPELGTRYPNSYLPDLRGLFIRGWDHGRGIDSGRGLLSYQADQLKAHNHTRPYGGSAQAGADNSGAPVGASTGYGTSRREGPTGTTGSTETRPRNLAFMYITRAE